MKNLKKCLLIIILGYFSWGKEVLNLVTKIRSHRGGFIRVEKQLRLIE